MVRIGLIGCGFYAQNHLVAWADLSERGAERSPCVISTKVCRDCGI